jgi:hypothetical protein
MSEEEKALEQEPEEEPEEEREFPEWKPTAQYELAVARGRAQRWAGKRKARVSHPAYGTVIVPHLSNYAAILNAAEYWKCPWTDLTDAAVVRVGPEEGPVVRPKEFCRKRREEKA